MALLGLAPPGATVRALGDERVDMASIDIESLLDLSVQAVTRRVERASEAPATVFVVTGEDIRRHGFRTLAEVLGSVPGLFAYPGNFPQVGVRGMGILGDFTTRVLVLIDGHPLSNSVGTDLARSLPIPLAALQRIEVIKGPAGSVYGPSALFGVVNLVSAGGPPGGDVRVGLERSQGGYPAREASAAWRAREGEVEGVVAAGYYSTRGLDYAFPELRSVPGTPPGGVVRGADFGDAGNGYGRLAWREIGASAACGHSFSGLSGVLTPDPRSVYEGRACFVDLSWQGAVAEGLSLMARLAYDDFEGRAGRALPEPPVSVGLFQDKGYDRWGTAELRADWRPHAVLRIDLGSSVKHHAVRHQAFSSAVPALAADLVNGFSEVNSWTSVELKAGRGLVLHGGLTVFHHSLFGTQLTPKLAAVWQPTPEDTAKAIWSMGFRPPTFVEARFTDNLAYLKNPDLKPEMVSSAELAYEHRFGGVASVGASFFWNAYRDLIRYETVVAPGLDHAPNPSNPSDFRQIPRNAPRSLGVLGADLSATLRFGRWAQAYGGVSLQRADETARPNFPGLTGNLTFSSRALWEPLLLSVRATALSARTKAPESVLPGQRAAVPAAVSLGAFAALEVPGVRNLQLELAVFNLLDGANPGPAPANLSPTEELPEAARTIRADLRWRF